MKRLLRFAVASSCALAVVSSASLAALEKRQDGEDIADPEHRAEAPERPADMPLADIPSPPSLERQEPRPRALEAIDRLLAEIVGSDPVLRERAQQSLLEAKSDWVSGIALRVDRIAERAERQQMDRVLEKAREKAKRTPGQTSEEESPDYLGILLEHPDPESQAWKDLTQILAQSRMLAAIGTTDAVREIIRIYVRFGDVTRIDCQRQLDGLGDRAVAGLLETLRHQAPAVQDWAKTRLRLMGKLSPHDAVRTEDPAALADILVALGRIGDPESTRLLISFSATDELEVRTAARQAIGLLGEPAAWQLRDAYLDTTGRTPPRDWTWKRTARELFTETDRLRLERVYRLFEKAKAAFSAGKLTEMKKGYDQILMLQPDFGRGEEMAPGYRQFAESVEEEHPEQALLALRRAARLDPDEASRRRTESSLLLLEAKLLRQRGVIDRSLVDRARQLDPGSESKAQKLATPGTGVTAWGAGSRYLVAGAVTLISLLGAGWVATSTLRRRGKEEPAPIKKEPRAEEPNAPEPTSPSEPDPASRAPASGAEELTDETKKGSP